jgi:hypothetical protein
MLILIHGVLKINFIYSLNERQQFLLNWYNSRFANQGFYNLMQCSEDDKIGSVAFFVHDIMKHEMYNNMTQQKNILCYIVYAVFWARNLY